MNDISRTPLLTAQRERDLARRLIRDNDSTARDELVRSNLCLVVTIARNYTHRGLDLQDLIAEGNIGLLKAVEGFNPELKIRFSTYSSWWIKQAIGRALQKYAPPFHIPGYLMAMIGKWKRAIVAMEDELGRSPTLLELSTHMSISLKKLRNIQQAARSLRRPLQSGANEDDGVTLVAMLQDERTSTPENVALDRDNLRLVHILLGRIDQRKSLVIRLRFGLEDGQSLTLEEIATKLELTRERVRQIENDALLTLSRLAADHSTKQNRCDRSADEALADAARGS